MESGEVLHQSFSQAWASLNREAVEEAGKIGEVRSLLGDEKFCLFCGSILSVVSSVLDAYCIFSPYANR